MANFHAKKLGFSRFAADGTKMHYYDIVVDTAADIPNPAEHPEWEIGSELVVLENGGSKYQLSNAREWVAVNFNSGGGGNGGRQLTTDFYQYFYMSHRLDELDVIDTSKGINFESAFKSCSTLTSIPHIDTSNGTNFDGMFEYCSKLVSISPLNTDKGERFARMFSQCYEIVSVPQFNTSKCKDFLSMFSGCMALKTIPQIDTSNGTNFASMFVSCSSLVSEPQIDTSNGTNFASMFSSCTGITNISKLNTSKGTNFKDMFQGCTNLATIDGIDLNSCTSFKDGYGQQYSLIRGCYKLSSMYVHNIRDNFVMYHANSDATKCVGTNLTTDCLVNTVKELCNVGSAKTLTLSPESKEKLNALYCRVLDNSTEKIEMELCESTDEGAITISEYVALKNWTIV